jgi:hypothetical protein
LMGREGGWAAVARVAKRHSMPPDLVPFIDWSERDEEWVGLECGAVRLRL